MIFEYKGFSADVEFDKDSNMWIGRLKNTDDYINFEAKNTESIDKEFHKAVDDYLKVREEIRRNAAFNKIKSPGIYKLPNSEECFVVPTGDKLVKFVYVGEPKIVEKSNGVFEIEKEMTLKELLDSVRSM